MTIPNVTGSLPKVPQQQQTPVAATVPQQTSQQTSQGYQNPVDVFETSTSQPQRRFNADIGRMREIWSENERQVESFRRLVETLLNNQIERVSAAGGEWDSSDPDAMVEIDEATRVTAAESIEKGGYYSAESVATRLLDFAVAVSGGDPSRLDVLRRAVERGFEAAERQWGGELPEISQQTRAAVMNGFDQWQANGSSSDISLLMNR